MKEEEPEVVPDKNEQFERLMMMNRKQRRAVGKGIPTVNTPYIKAKESLQSFKLRTRPDILSGIIKRALNQGEKAQELSTDES